MAEYQRPSYHMILTVHLLIYVLSHGTECKGQIWCFDADLTEKSV